MDKTFVETREFTEWVKNYLSDEALSALQAELLENPDTGTVMPGCGGLRKMRAADPSRGKGKRGGVRVIYLHVTEADIIFLMDIYGKGEQEDLTSGQKKILQGIAQVYKHAAIESARVFRKGTS
jgi:hypothetical protein